MVLTLITDYKFASSHWYVKCNSVRVCKFDRHALPMFLTFVVLSLKVFVDILSEHTTAAYASVTQWLHRYSRNAKVCMYITY